MYYKFTNYYKLMVHQEEQKNLKAEQPRVCDRMQKTLCDSKTIFPHQLLFTNTTVKTIISVFSTSNQLHIHIDAVFKLHHLPGAT